MHKEVPYHKKDRSYLISILFNDYMIMANRRHRTDIIVQILKSAQYSDTNRGGITRSRLMYKTFLSSGQVAQFLPMLVESDLLKYRTQNKTYRIAEKGLRFIKLYDQVNQLTTITETKKQ